jgi:transketolase
MHTLKPLDHAAIERAAKECGAIVTAEEHQIHGGLGGAVAEVVVSRHPVPMELVAVRDRFGRSGKQDELMAAFGIKSPDVIQAAEKVLARKRPG